MQEAYREKNKKDFLKYSKEYLHRFDLDEELLSTNRRFLLGVWLERAKRLGKNEYEKRYFEFSARLLVTVWAGKKGDSLHDYSAREYSGLLSDHYKRRWEEYISRLELSLDSGEPIIEYDKYDTEAVFAYGRKEYPTEPKKNNKEMIEKIIRKIESSIERT